MLARAIVIPMTSAVEVWFASSVISLRRYLDAMAQEEAALIIVANPTLHLPLRHTIPVSLLEGTHD